MDSNRRSVPQQIDALLALERGWDSYDGLPPDEKTVYMAAGLAGRLEVAFSSPPSLVPLSDGSVQVEWHCDGWDVELAVERVRDYPEHYCIGPDCPGCVP